MIYYLAHPKLRTLFFLTGIFILIGVIVFSAVEKWTLIDALYYTVSTVTTVGYGDLVPTHPASKLLASLYMLFTIPFILISIGLTTEVVRDYTKSHKEGLGKRMLNRKKR